MAAGALYHATSAALLAWEGATLGAQGGDAAATVKAAWRPDGPIIVNSSRAVLYAGDGEDFAQKARQVAVATRDALNAARPA